MLGSHYPSCRRLRELLEAARESVALYYSLVEPVMGHDRHRETLASSRILHDTGCYRECVHVSELRERVNGKRICVFGPLAALFGELEPYLEGCDEVASPEGGHVALVSAGLRPLFITSDLDSSLSSLSTLSYYASYLLVHLHSDNHYRVSWATACSSPYGARVVYTSQVETVGCTLPLGGYTDGDRAVVLSIALGAAEVRMIGFGRLRERGLEALRAFAIPYKDYADDRLLEASSAKHSLGLMLLQELARRKGYKLRVSKPREPGAGDTILFERGAQGAE